MSKNPFDDDYHFPGNASVLSNNGYSAQSRALASQQRALSSIANSERLGIGTLEELSEQGEKLSLAEDRVRQMSELQKDGQRHINSLSSFFGGFINMFSKKPAESPTTVVQPKLSQTVSSPLLTQTSQKGDQLSAYPRYQPPLVSQASSKSNFDNNLDNMSVGMSRLKELASTMNSELRNQNEQLDRLQPSIDRVSGVMTQQNRQMNKLLGTKEPPRSS